jgi:hypothetical protein
MKRNLNKKIIVLLLVIFSSPIVKAQSGFMGKKNNLDFDVFGMVSGNYGFNYKLSYSKRTSLLLNFNYTHNISTPTNSIINSNNYYNSQNNLDLYIPKAIFNGFTGGLGFVWNSGYAGMNMPIGYYTGFSFEVCKGSLQNIIPMSSITSEIKYTEVSPWGGYDSKTIYYYPNKYDLNYDFKVTGFHFNLFYGKNIYIAKNICIDLGLKTGVAYYSYKPNNFKGYPISTSSYNSLEPKHTGNANDEGYTIYSDDIYYSKTENFNLIPNLYPKNIYDLSGALGIGEESLISSNNYNYSSIDSPTSYHRLKFILSPQIKIGYLF